LCKRPTPKGTAAEGCVTRCLKSSSRNTPLNNKSGTDVTETGTYLKTYQQAGNATAALMPGATFGKRQRTPVPAQAIPKILDVTCFLLNLLLSILYSDAARCAVGR
jgi:hypothetical protein